MKQLDKSFKNAVLTILIMHIILGFSSVVLFERTFPQVKGLAQIGAESVININDLSSLIYRTQVDPKNYDEQAILSILDRIKLHLKEINHLQLIKKMEMSIKSTQPWNKYEVTRINNLLVEISRSYQKEIYNQHKDLKNLEIASSWSVELLVLIGFFLLIFILYKISRQSIEPINELCRGLIDIRKGNSLRRFSSIEGTEDIREAMQALNDILDKKV